MLFPKSIATVGLLIAILALTGCKTVGTTSPTVDLTRQQQIDRAQFFAKRIGRMSKKRMVFGLASRVEDEQIDVIQQFAEDTGIGTLIFSGNPSFLLEIEFKSEPILGGNNQQRYRVFFKDADTKKVLATGTSLVKCRPHKGPIPPVFYSSPPACRHLKSKGLAAALYSL